MRATAESCGSSRQAAATLAAATKMVTNVDEQLVPTLKTDLEALQRVLGNVRSVDGRQLLFPHQEGEVVKESVP